MSTCAGINSENDGPERVPWVMDAGPVTLVWNLG